MSIARSQLPTGCMFLNGDRSRSAAHQPPCDRMRHSPWPILAMQLIVPVIELVKFKPYCPQRRELACVPLTKQCQSFCLLLCSYRAWLLVVEHHLAEASKHSCWVQ